MNPQANPKDARGRAPQGGFTLVELLVAIALGLLVMIALVAVYLNVSRTNSEMTKTNSLIENGRFAIDVMNEDIVHAGFWGGYVPPFDSLSSRVAPTNVPGTTAYALGPCLAYANWETSAPPGEYKDYLVGVPVEAYRDAAPTGCSAVVTDRKAGTDVLVVRHADTCIPGVNFCEAADSTKIYFQASNCDKETEATPALRYVMSNNTADFVLHGRGCSNPPVASDSFIVSPIRKFVSNIYYVRTWATTAGDGIPTLVRSTFGKAGGVPAHEPPQALIEGIESFGVELGVDNAGRCAGSATDYTQTIQLVAGNLVDPTTCVFNAGNLPVNTMPMYRGDGVPDKYVRCPDVGGGPGCTVEALRDVVAVKLHVLTRSRDPSGGHTDTRTYTLGSGGTDTLVVTPSGTDQKYKRHVFQTTIRLNNVSGRRETP
jgi:type IV pilus assembly protein PilW